MLFFTFRIRIFAFSPQRRYGTNTVQPPAFTIPSPCVPMLSQTASTTSFFSIAYLLILFTSAFIVRWHKNIA